MSDPNIMERYASLLDDVRALRAADPNDPGTVKACCATAYGIDLIALLLGESYHPGGVALTHRLASVVGLRPGQQVLDVASGIGTTALVLAASYDVEVTGVDLGERQISRARARAVDAGLDGQVRFELGDAEQLPFADASFDVIVSECAFCTFPDKATAGG